MAELHERVRGRLRERLLSHGASREFDDPALFADVERILQSATSTADAQALLLPELLGSLKAGWQSDFDVACRPRWIDYP